MKRFFTSLVMAVTIQFIFAQCEPIGSIVNIRLSTMAPLKVFLNGQCMTEGLATTVNLNNVPAGRHFIQIYSIDNSWGFETMDNAYRGYMTVAPQTESFITVLTDCNKLNYDRVVSMYQQRQPQTPGICFYPRPGNVCVKNEPVVPVCQQPQPMCNADFMQLKQAIANASFESTRMSIFKQALAHSYFTSVQVQSLMNEFWFESTRLEVAKLAYLRTVDQQSYYLVNNSFNFSSSVEHLGEYIAML